MAPSRFAKNDNDSAFSLFNFIAERVPLPLLHSCSRKISLRVSLSSPSPPLSLFPPFIFLLDPRSISPDLAKYRRRRMQARPGLRATCSRCAGRGTGIRSDSYPFSRMPDPGYLHSRVYFVPKELSARLILAVVPHPVHPL